MAKGPESAKQARLHSLGLQRDREISMRAHTPRKSQKELQYSWLQRSARGKSTCQSIAQQLPGINIFKTIRHWNSKENLSQNHRFSITFGYLLDPWTPSGRDLAAKGKPSEFWTPFLLDFWWIWGTLGYPFGSILAGKPSKNISRAPFFEILEELFKKHRNLHDFWLPPTF